jgi:hypothetical protein
MSISQSFEKTQKRHPKELLKHKKNEIGTTYQSISRNEKNAFGNFNTAKRVAV